MTAIRHILVPVDFSPGSKAALEYAITIAERFGADVAALHVWEAPIYLTPEMLVQVPGDGARPLADYVKARAADSMEQLLASPSIDRRGVKVGGSIEGGPVVARILKAAAGYDLVVMGTHGRRGLSRLLIGSVAERVVRRAPCPVLTVRAGSEEEEMLDISEEDLP